MDRIAGVASIAAWLWMADAAAAAVFIRGDADGSGVVEITDAVATLGALFLDDEPLRCADAADANDDGAIDIADAVHGLSFLFLGGEAPPPPFPDPGEDPTADVLPGCVPCPGDASCAIEEDRWLDAFGAYRNGTPSIAVDADGRVHVLFPAGLEAIYAVREPDGAWHVEDVIEKSTGAEVKMAFGSIAVRGGAREPTALLDLGCFSPGCAQVWDRAADGRWERVHSFDESALAARNALLADQGGGLRAGLVRFPADARQQLAVGRLVDGAWEIENVGERASVVQPTLALSPWGEAFLAFWRSTAGDWELAVAGATLEPVPVAVYGSNLLDDGAIAVAVAGVPGVPRFHVLAPVASGESGDPRVGLDVVTGAPGEGWEVEALARGDSRSREPSFCFEAPPTDGAECFVDFTRYHALAAIEQAGGAVRYLYSRVRSSGRLVTECFVPEDWRTCWIRSEIAFDGDLRLAWFGGGVLESAVLATGVAARSGNAVLDASGRLHVVVFDIAGEDSGDSKVRYMRFAARHGE